MSERRVWDLVSSRFCLSRRDSRALTKSVRALTTARVASLDSFRDLSNWPRRGRYIGGEGKWSDCSNEE